MAEHDQQPTMGTQDCSVLSDASSEEVTQAVDGLSEFHGGSDAQHRQQSRFDTEGQLSLHHDIHSLTWLGLTSQSRRRDSVAFPESDQLTTREELTQDVVSNGGPAHSSQHTNQHFSTEQSDTVLTSPTKTGDGDMLSHVPTSLQHTPALPAKPQSRIHDSASPHMQALIEQVPSLGLDLNKCKGRCGRIVFDVLAPVELSDRFKKHKESLSKIIAELSLVVAAHLGIPSDDPNARSRIEEFVQALYYKAREELHQAARLQQPFPPVAKSGSFSYNQLCCLMQLLREVDKMLRAVDKDDLPVFGACCTVAAMQWQIDIHKHWIAELGGDKKRKDHENDDSAGGLRKHRRTTSIESKSDESNTVSRRRPGRPPGALNKTTVAAREREAAIAAARGQNGRSPISTTPAPQTRGMPVHTQYQGYPANVSNAQLMTQQAPHQAHTPGGRLVTRHRSTAALYAHSYGYPQGHIAQSMHVAPSGRRGAVSSGSSHVDYNLPQQVESLSSGLNPQFFLNHPSFRYKYYGPVANQQPSALERCLEEGDDEPEERL